MNKKLIPSLILYYNYIQPHVPIGEIRKIFHLHFFQMRFTFDQQTVSNRTFSMGQISIRYKAPKFLIYIINNPFCFFAEHVASVCLGLSKNRQYPMSFLTLKMRWFTIFRYKYWYASVLPPYIALPKQVEVTVIANRDVKWTAAYVYC